MNIRIVNYVPSVSPLVHAFVDLELDGWLRFNGLNLLRDGRSFRDAVQILDSHLATLVAADILDAIRKQNLPQAPAVE